MFTKTGQKAYLAFYTTFRMWIVREVVWIATTTEGDHVIEVAEKQRCGTNKVLKRSKHAYPTESEAYKEAEKRQQLSREWEERPRYES